MKNSLLTVFVIMVLSSILRGCPCSDPIDEKSPPFFEQDLTVAPPPIEDSLQTTLISTTSKKVK